MFIYAQASTVSCFTTKHSCVHFLILVFYQVKSIFTVILECLLVFIQLGVSESLRELLKSRYKTENPGYLAVPLGVALQCFSRINSIYAQHSTSKVN